MDENDKNLVPRRKTLLATASIGSAVTGLSTGALADDGGETDSSTVQQSPTDRDSERPSAKPAAPDKWLTEDWEFDIPQEELNDVEVEVYESRTEQELDEVAVRAVNPKEVSTFEERRPIRPAVAGVEYTETIVKASKSGYTLKIEAAVVADLAAGVANISLSIDFNGFVFEVLSLGLTRGEGKNICIEPNPPKALPLSIQLCPVIRFKNNNKIKFGGSGNFCVGIDCPLPGGCEVCRGFGINATIDL